MIKLSMKKRLPKTDQKNKLLIRKKRIRKRLEKNAAANTPKELSAQRKNIVLACLLAGAALFIFFYPKIEFSQPSHDYRNELIEKIAHANEIKAASLKPKEPSELNKKIISIVKDTPMEKMADDIAAQDKLVAAFIIGIAMKESKFGTYAPKKNGVDCYNYWGYRGKENPTVSGYSCFGSPSHAISVVGGRIESMVNRGARRPADMISWKCGSTCAGHDPESVTKWIEDVAINYYKLNPIKEIAEKN